jgi:hypothetical protein
MLFRLAVTHTVERAVPEHIGLLRTSELLLLPHCGCMAYSRIGCKLCPALAACGCVYWHGCVYVRGQCLFAAVPAAGLSHCMMVANGLQEHTSPVYVRIYHY